MSIFLREAKMKKRNNIVGLVDCLLVVIPLYSSYRVQLRLG